MIAIMRFPQAMRASPKPFAFITLIFYFCHKFPLVPEPTIPEMHDICGAWDAARLKIC